MSLLLRLYLAFPTFNFGSDYCGCTQLDVYNSKTKVFHDNAWTLFVQLFLTWWPLPFKLLKQYLYLQYESGGRSQFVTFFASIVVMIALFAGSLLNNTPNVCILLRYAFSANSAPCRQLFTFNVEQQDVLHLKVCQFLFVHQCFDIFWKQKLLIYVLCIVLHYSQGFPDSPSKYLFRISGLR